MKFLANKDEDYLKTYFYFHQGQNPDVDENEMAESESNSKYAFCLGTRISLYFDENQWRKRKFTFRYLQILRKKINRDLDKVYSRFSRSLNGLWHSLKDSILRSFESNST